MLVLLDLLSTVCFAGAGASIALRARMKIFGVSLSAMLASTGGGTTREILLGSNSLFWIESPVYLLAVFLAIPLAFLLGKLTRFPKLFRQLLDSMGTSVFIMVGVLAAIEANCNWLVVLLMGAWTGIGGGIIRQVVFERKSAICTQMKIISVATTAFLCMVSVELGAGMFFSIALLGLVHFAINAKTAPKISWLAQPATLY